MEKIRIGRVLKLAKTNGIKIITNMESANPI